MTQDESDFIGLINSNLGYEEAILLLKKNGAFQMTCTKVIRKVYGISLSEANRLVQNSEHWKSHKAGNEGINDMWFDG